MKEEPNVKKILPIITALLLITTLSQAQENVTLEIFHKTFPNMKAERIAKSEIAGLYEVQAGNNIFYFDPTTGYLLFGDILTRDGKNLSAEKREDLLSRRVQEIPLEKGVKIGSGKNVVVEFTDPDCPFCRKTAEWFEKTRADVTRYVFFYPIARLHPKAEAKAKYILAARDKGKAYREVMKGALDNADMKTLEASDKSGVLLEEHRRLALKAGVFATPTLWVNGKHVAGANIPLIEKYLKGEKQP